MTDEQIHNRLNRLIKEHRLSIRKAADIAGVSPSTFQNWTEGATPKDFLALQRLASHLSVSLCFLLTGTDDTPNSRPPSIEEVFSGKEEVFTGLVEVTITRMIPKLKKGTEE